MVGGPEDELHVSYFKFGVYAPWVILVVPLISSFLATDPVRASDFVDFSGWVRLSFMALAIFCVWLTDRRRFSPDRDTWFPFCCGLMAFVITLIPNKPPLRSLATLFFIGIMFALYASFVFDKEIKARRMFEWEQREKAEQ